jgi:hypothetical protein
MQAWRDSVDEEGIVSFAPAPSPSALKTPMGANKRPDKAQAAMGPTKSQQPPGSISPKSMQSPGALPKPRKPAAIPATRKPRKPVPAPGLSDPPDDVDRLSASLDRMTAAMTAQFE